MLVGAKILTTKKGIVKVLNIKKMSSLSFKIKNIFIKYIIKKLQNNKNKFKVSSDFKEKYTMENIVKNFLRKKMLRKFLRQISIFLSLNTKK